MQQEVGGNRAVSFVRFLHRFVERRAYALPCGSPAAHRGSRRRLVASGQLPPIDASFVAARQIRAFRRRYATNPRGALSFLRWNVTKTNVSVTLCDKFSVSVQRSSLERDSVQPPYAKLISSLERDKNDNFGDAARQNWPSSR
ncbi:hypothetical protein ACV229_38030 [Burkholderia sp. MR1-5-21]